jgi:hypothetical protein
VAFLDVNPKKLAYLLEHGTDQAELRRFFVESKKRLLLKGARVQNLPQVGERIRTICEHLPSKTADTVREWFYKNISVGEPLSLSDVLTYLELHFDDNEVIPAAEAKLTSRSALMYLFADEPDQKLVAFLKRAPGTKASTTVDTPDTLHGTTSDVDTLHTPESIPVGEVLAPKIYQLSELIASILAGDESAIGSALLPFPQSVKTLVEALLSIRDGSVGAATEQLATLETGTPEWELVHAAIGRARHQRGTGPASIGIRVVSARRLTDHPESDSFDVIGTFTNESETRAIFVQPVFLVVDRQLYALSQEDRLSLFPESGSVMTSRSYLRRTLQPREVVHWKVAGRDGAEGKTRFHLESELPPLIEVIHVHVPSTDPDEVRERIKQIASSRRRPSGQQLAFYLSDGVVVASPKTADITREDAYDLPWEAWTSLETWLVEGRQYCLDLVHSAASHLDMSPLDTAFKKLLTNIEAEQKSKLTKTQKQELADHFRRHSIGEASLRAKRVAESIDQIVLDGEQLDAVLRLLNSRDDVKRQVEQLIAKSLEEKRAEKCGLQTDLEILKRKKADLAKECKELEGKNRKLVDSTEASVKEAFSRAVNDGITTLASAEIFRTLALRGIDLPTQYSPLVETNAIESWTLHGALTQPEARAQLIALGLNGRQALVLSELSVLAMNSNVGFVLRGQGARQYVQVLARIEHEVTGMVEIPMGLTSGASVRRALDRMSDVRTLAILDADLSPLEVYGARLLDSLFRSSLDDRENQKTLLFSCVGGDMSLPLPDSLQKVVVSVDLDTDWDDGQLTLDEIEIESIALLKPLRSRLLGNIALLDSSRRALFERVIVKVCGL